MSHRGVENVLGRLATDPEARKRFRLAPVEALNELISLGLVLTAVEIEALKSLDPTALDRFAHALDRRLQRAVLVSREADSPSGADASDSGE
jgi:hypothetical protein